MRLKGTVKFFDDTKGFGFIAREDQAPDVFVHITTLKKANLSSLGEGQRVSFDTEPGRNGKGPQAVNIQLA